jgi:undecaprenyl-diphosphatase
VNSIEALFLGLVQGLTEFLPVSSSGHLVVFGSLLGLEADGNLLFEVGVHVASLLAIAIFYRQKILELVRGIFAAKPGAIEYVGKLVVATLPAVAVALGLNGVLDRVLSSPEIAAVGLLLTSLILWTTRSTLPRATGLVPGWGAALLIGVAQALAILPGVSRSGSTVAVALALGIAPAAAAEFSFLMGIIAISSAAVLMLPDLGQASPEALASLALGCATALGSGILAIWLFVVVLRRQTFYQFAYYTFAVGTAFGLYLLLG